MNDQGKQEQRNRPVQIDRRGFLQAAAAGAVAVGLTACTYIPPAEQIIPYVREPENLVPAVSNYYATATTLNGHALGVLVECREGRPIKVEGNPLHPASLGATDAFAQAAVLCLYDPARSSNILYRGEIRTSETFQQDMTRALAVQHSKGGKGLRVLTETISSPTLAYQLQGLLAAFPGAVWHEYNPITRDNERAAAIASFGTDVEPIYRFDSADTIVALGADTLLDSPGRVRYAHDIAIHRSLAGGLGPLSRIYAIESTHTTFGSIADQRIVAKPSEIVAFAEYLGQLLATGRVQAATTSPAILDQRLQAAARAIASNLQAHRGRSVLVAGRQQPAEVHALVNLINSTLGNIGQTIYYTRPVAARSVDQVASLRSLVADIDAGKVDMLFIIRGNPAYDAPADFQFADRLQKVPWSARLGLFRDETSEKCVWHLPATHEFEMWGDTRAFDGTVSIIQPVISPLYQGISEYELIDSVATTGPSRRGYDIIRSFWAGTASKTNEANVQASNTASPALNADYSVNSNSSSAVSSPNAASSANSSTAPLSAEFEGRWREHLQTGIVEGTGYAPVAVAGASVLPPALTSPAPVSTEYTLEALFRPDDSIWDGRFATNAWLQELPKPFTKLTWDNAVLISPATAARLGISNEIAWVGGSHGQTNADTVQLELVGRTVVAPAFIVEGIADDTAILPLGYGRMIVGNTETIEGNPVTGYGFNSYLLRTSDAMWHRSGLIMTKTGGRYSLACTQRHHSMEGRDLDRFASYDEYLQNPDFAKGKAAPPEDLPSLYPNWRYDGHAWGMAIDNSICVGCNACVVACQAENNIPVVGKDEVLRAREMHWIRIDQYYEDGVVLNMPVPCQHCEKAPCEVVCPTEATSHSSEGINEMTYQRCIGTRYCSNNCPYKVRRFNYFGYGSNVPPVVQLQRNPEVTIRSRGVMEKCTYCIQRIRHSEIAAQREERDILDGEVTPACAQACPTQAIVFGDINDPNSRVAKLKADPLNYPLLGELNTRPRTTYLATVRNKDPEIT